MSLSVRPSFEARKYAMREHRGARASDAENVSAPGIKIPIRFSNSTSFVIPGRASLARARNP